jgi:hypothetical protein
MLTGVLRNCVMSSGARGVKCECSCAIKTTTEDGNTRQTQGRTRGRLVCTVFGLFVLTSSLADTAEAANSTDRAPHESISLRRLPKQCPTATATKAAALF